MNRHLMVIVLVVLVLGTATRAHGQHLYVSCTVSTPADTASTIEFGLNMTALDGIDEFDEPLPPATPAQNLLVYLQMVTPPAPLPRPAEIH